MGKGGQIWLKCITGDLIMMIRDKNNIFERVENIHADLAWNYPVMAGVSHRTLPPLPSRKEKQGGSLLLGDTFPDGRSGISLPCSRSVHFYSKSSLPRSQRRGWLEKRPFSNAHIKVSCVASKSISISIHVECPIKFSLEIFCEMF